MKRLSLELNEVRPLPIIKQIFTMFCDINPQITTNDPEVRNLILNKYSQTIDRSKYRIFMYLMIGGIEKTAGFTAEIIIGQDSPLVLSEIATVPVGFILYKDLPVNYKTNLTEITSFLDYEYDDIASVKMSVNVYEINSWLPGDFRSKQEIQSTIEESKREN